MNPECAFTQTINRAVKNARLEALTGRSDRIVYLQLPATWDEWLKGLKSDRRRKVLQTRKKMAEPNRYFVWSDPATLDQGVDRLVELHRKRWDNGPERSYSWSSPEYIGFHRAVMSACLKKDRLRLYCLELSGQIIALLYFYKFRDQLYLMQSGYDPEHNKLSPGQALLFFVVENAIGEGNKVIDFLKGDHRYKDELATGERETVYLTAFGRRPGAWVYRARRMYLPAIKARLIELLRRARPAPKTE
jgi:CelD/BcsL family acetyltransferase involved in cellulose biosynthesis